MSSGSETNRQFSLKHIKHETKLNNSFYSMLKDQNLVDVILSSEGNNIRAHRLVLSANSSYLKNLFENLTPCQTPVIVLKEVPLLDLKAIIEFMYRGEVFVEEKQLSSVLKSAELLKVFGLTEVCLALRSQLSHEKSVTSQTSGVSPLKRPRISDGLNDNIQHSNDSLFSRLSNARFEIRPTQRIQNVQSNQQKGTTGTTAVRPAVVKNVIIPSTQIHCKTTSSNIQTFGGGKSGSNDNNTSVSDSCQSKQIVQTINISQPIVSPTTSSGRETLSPCVQIINPKRVVSSSTWTPSPIPLSQPMQTPSSSRDSTTNAPIEVVIDDEPHDASEMIDTDIDVKPPIFELNKTIGIGREISGSELESEIFESLSDTGLKVAENKTQSKGSSNEEYRTRSRTSSIKSRTSSTSSQSLPPPPSYRLVKRSSSRLLRNIIRPPPSISPSTIKTRESDDKSKVRRLKKERPVVGVVKYRKSQMETSGGSGAGDGPEIECPSCGQKFTNEDNWNQHIANYHLTQN